MKNILIALLVAVAVTVAAQDVKLSPPSNFDVTAVAVRSFEKPTYRVGAGFPVLNFRNGNVNGYPSIATANAWILTDAEDMKGLYLGGGLHLPLFTGKNARFGGVLGWSGDFSNLEHVRNGQWGAGVFLNVRF